MFAKFALFKVDSVALALILQVIDISSSKFYQRIRQGLLL